MQLIDGPEGQELESFFGIDAAVDRAKVHKIT